MQDRQPFKPVPQQTRFCIEVTSKEAQLIKRLRQYRFGHFIVHKQDNQLIRVEIGESIILDGSEGEELAVS